MSDIKISENLSQKLGEETLGKIRFLTDFEAGIKEKLSQDNCPDEVRNIVSNKMKAISELILKLHTISRTHCSNDEKKEKIQAALSGMDTKEFLEVLDQEIKGTREILLLKAKGMGKEIEQDGKEAVDSIEKMIKSNQELVSEEKSRLKQEEDKLKQEENPKRRRYNPKGVEHSAEKAVDAPRFVLDDPFEDRGAQLPVKVENLGFWKTFKKLRSEGKEKSDKKIGIFSALKAAWNANISASNVDYAKIPEKQADEFYKKQVQLEQKIKKCEEDYKKLSEQLKEVKKELERLSVEGMKNTKSAFEEAVKPVSGEEITEERLSGVVERIAEFSRNISFREWARNVKTNLAEKVLRAVDSGRAKAAEIKGKIGDKIDDIEVEILEGKILKTDEKRKEKWEVSKVAKGKFKEAKEVRDDSENNFTHAKKAAENSSHRVSRRLIRGISAAEYILSNTKYKLKSGKFDREVKKYERSSDKLDKYMSKRREVLDRRDARKLDMDR